MADFGSSAPTRDVGVPDLSWGTWGQGLLSDWWETAADLIWPQSVVTYGRMRHDPQLKQVLSAFKMPIMRANWVLDPLGARGEVVQRCADDLGLPILGRDEKPGSARRRGVIWKRHVSQALDELVYGHMPFELRYEIVGSQPGDCHLIHLGPRMPWTIATINLAKDSTIDHIVQTTQVDPIPGNRLVWYSYGQEGANWAGISLLRPAFGAWLLKHETWRVHATSIRRFGMGVPQVTAPPGATQGQVQDAQALASAIRVGDQTGVGIPAGFQFSLAGLTGSVPDALAFIKYLDQQMAGMALTQGLLLGQTETGSRALGESFLDLYLLALQGVADELATTATSGQESMPGIITDLVDQNWGPDEPCPAVICTDVGESYEITAEAIATLTRYGALSPDATLDSWIRKMWRMPARTVLWQPTHMGLPAAGQPGGAFLPAGATPAPLVPEDDEGWTDLEPSWEAPPPAVPPAPAEPPASQDTPPPQDTPPAPAQASRRRTARATPPDGLRRNLTKAEAASGWSPLTMRSDHQQALDELLAAWPAIWRDQRASLVDQVIAATDKGQLAKLATLKVDTSAGAELLATALKAAAALAAQRMIGEAASQGVTIPAGRVKVNGARLVKVAAGRAALAGAYAAQQAGIKAMQVVQASAGSNAGDAVHAFLGGLSEVSLRDQLGAALMSAQNAGRVAVLEAAPESAGQSVEYTATEINDHNTCSPCIDIDGTVFTDLPEAESAYANGGYIECEGGLRCRGTVIAVWGLDGGTTDAPAGY